MLERPGMSVTTSLRSVMATRYVTALREGGSLPGLVEADDDGLYVTKFRGAGQGVRALIAEVIVGELARRLGFLVPELVTVAIDARLGAAEPDPEIQELILGSEGENLGVDFLPGALAFTPAEAWQPTPELAAEVVWLDALSTNVDRTPRNPNLLLWHERLWLIDHGAALYLQHGGLDPEAHPERPFPLIAQHVLLAGAASVLEADERLRGRLAPAAVSDAVALVPPGWFAATDPPGVYVDYLTRRLASGGFAEEAERARVALTRP
jgi:HipA-like protein